MSKRTLGIFALTIVTMIVLVSSGAVVYTDTIAEGKNKLVGGLIMIAMSGSCLLGSLATGYSSAIDVFEKDRDEQ